MAIEKGINFEICYNWLISGNSSQLIKKNFFNNVLQLVDLVDWLFQVGLVNHYNYVIVKKQELCNGIRKECWLMED
ncbi:hypothetical protein JA1_005158 [Spathaspora sp. JA1]|nr:hypothetical protein JA1_005158 [Spathaspora sp. JA1]